ncbi:MAG: hypothetical protein WBA59_03965 [Moheibacter sp.]
MYRINRLNRNVLITPDEVLFHISSDQGVNERQILNNIIVAEERFIVDSLCRELYEDFIEKKNKTVTETNRTDLINKINESLTAVGKNTITEDDLPIGTIVNAIEFVDDENYEKLWNLYLWKIVSECVDLMSTVPSWLRHTAQGQQMNNPKVIGGNSTNSASGESKDVKFKLDIMLQDRINPLLSKMEEWLCRNKTGFKLYCKKCHCEESAENIITKDTNFIFGIYED